jgi:hypothetical protein
MVTVVMSLMARRELSVLLDLIPRVRLPLYAAAQTVMEALEGTK